MYFLTISNNKALQGETPKTVTDTNENGSVVDTTALVKSLTNGCVVIGLVKNKPHLLVVYNTNRGIIWYYDRRVNQMVCREPKDIPIIMMGNVNELPVEKFTQFLDDLYATSVIEAFDGQYYPPTPFTWTVEVSSEEDIKKLSKMGCFPKRINDKTVVIKKPQGAKVNKIIKSGYRLWRDDHLASVK